MKRTIPFLLLILLPGCEGSTLERSDRGSMKKNPISIRGWIAGIDTGAPPPGDVFAVTSTDLKISPYQSQLFQETNLSIEGVVYASGGVSDNGSFVVLDSPPGDVVLNFQAPGISLVQLRMSGIPPSADVLIPAIQVHPDRIEILDPKSIAIRVPAPAGGERKRLDEKAIVGEHQVEVWQVPLRDMMDRRDWPVPR
ncbi:MAG TPA: hypothetical protein VM557_13265 [Thermoanaerobaculia bacterium]|nr:hypothetical protein [Thermoanaerobaculia bacterium]